MGPPKRGSPLDCWKDFKKRLFKEDRNELFERAIQKLKDPGWLIEHGVEQSDLHAELVTVNRAEGGVGNPDGPHIRFEMNHLVNHQLWDDIVFVCNGNNWTPDLVLPYKLALEEVCVGELGYEFDCALSVGGSWAYCR